jgi:hypothetical protein
MTSSSGSLASLDSRRIAEPPDCAACGERMQLAGTAPHMKFRRLKIRRYDCECGRTSEEAVLHES